MVRATYIDVLVWRVGRLSRSRREPGVIYYWAEPDMQISRIRLSDKTSRLHPRHVVPKLRPLPSMQKRQQLLPIVGILRVRSKEQPIAGSRQRDFQDAPNSRGRSICHHQDAIAKKDRFVNIMCDHDNRRVDGLDDTNEFILKACSRQSVKRPKRFIQKEHAWRG